MARQALPQPTQPLAQVAFNGVRPRLCCTWRTLDRALMPAQSTLQLVDLQEGLREAGAGLMVFVKERGKKQMVSCPGFGGEGARHTLSCDTHVLLWCHTGGRWGHGSEPGGLGRGSRMRDPEVGVQDDKSPKRGPCCGFLAQELATGCIFYPHRCDMYVILGHHLSRPNRAGREPGCLG